MISDPNYALFYYISIARSSFLHLQDLSVFMVNNADDMDKLMTMGNRNRSIGATNMNALSSRSHAIFSITVECSEKTVGNTSFPNVTVIF